MLIHNNIQPKTEKKQFTTSIPQGHIKRMWEIKNEVGIPISIQIEKALDKMWGDVE